MTFKSKRQHLRYLRTKYPNWTTRQYAEALGQSVDTVRTTLSVLGLSRTTRGGNRYRKDYKKPRPEKKEAPKPVFASQANRVFARCGSRGYSSGYTKLM